MNQRIRYIKSTEGYTSMRILKSKTGKEYLSNLSNNMLVGIVTTSTGEVVQEVHGSSHHKTKIALKKALANLGVEFASEGRVPRKKKE